MSQTLYALRVAGMTDRDPPLARGTAWLIAHQAALPSRRLTAHPMRTWLEEPENSEAREGRGGFDVGRAVLQSGSDQGPWGN